jgi:hypothetical protein
MEWKLVFRAIDSNYEKTKILQSDNGTKWKLVFQSNWQQLREIWVSNKVMQWQVISYYPLLSSISIIRHYQPLSVRELLLISPKKSIVYWESRVTVQGLGRGAQAGLEYESECFFLYPSQFWITDRAFFTCQLRNMVPVSSWKTGLSDRSTRRHLRIVHDTTYKHAIYLHLPEILYSAVRSAKGRTTKI